MCSADRKVPYVIFSIVSLLIVLTALGYYPFQIDDSYIAYRYAANVLHGYGFTFNPGGVPVEGFTSPLWMALLIGLGAIFSVASLPVVTPWIGVGVAMLVVAVMGRILLSDRAEDRSPLQNTQYLIGTLLLGFLPAVSYYAVSGMDEILFCLVVLIAAGIGARRLSVGFLSVLVLASWVRPEALWIPVMMAVQLMVLGGSGKILLTRRFIQPVAMLAFGFVALVCVRWFMFSDVLPNTYYAKRPEYLLGLHYVWNTLGTGWAGLTVAMGLLGAILGRREHLSFFVAGLSWFPAVVLEGGDWMPFSRMLLPALVLFCLAASGIAEVGARFETRRFHAGLLLLLIPVCGYQYLESRHQQWEETLGQFSFVHEIRLLSSWLNTNNIHSVALVDIGEVGFRTNTDILDLAGLTDKNIARAKGGLLSKDFDVTYLTDVKKPEVVIIRFSKPLEFTGRLSVVANSTVEQHVLSSDAFARDYVPYLAIVPGYHRDPYYGRLLFLRRGVRIDDHFLQYYHTFGNTSLNLFEVPLSKSFRAFLNKGY